jgi:K+-transporting ATPase ATPase C chain
MYNTLPSGGSNYGLTNKKLKELVVRRKHDFCSFNQLDSLTLIPAEMLFASASGLDPHISPRAAMLQVNRIAKARHFNDASTQKLIKCIKNLTESPQFLCLGEERVNVLLLNLEADKIE